MVETSHDQLHVASIYCNTANHPFLSLPQSARRILLGLVKGNANGSSDALRSSSRYIPFDRASDTLSAAVLLMTWTTYKGHLTVAAQKIQSVWSPEDHWRFYRVCSAMVIARLVASASSYDQSIALTKLSSWSASTDLLWPTEQMPFRTGDTQSRHLLFQFSDHGTVFCMDHSDAAKFPTFGEHLKDFIVLQHEHTFVRHEDLEGVDS